MTLHSSEYLNMLMFKMFLSINVPLRPNCVVFLSALCCMRYCKIFLRTVYNIRVSSFRAVVSKVRCVHARGAQGDPLQCGKKILELQ